MISAKSMKRAPFLCGVFLISFSLLIFQILQTRILSVIAWYYMAFFAISVAMLGMTVGAVGVFLWRERLERSPLATVLTRFALLTAVAMPGSMAVQFCLMTTIAPSLTTVLAWALLLAAMAVPYVFAGVVVSLALTRSRFPPGQVYGVDLVGAALGCFAVIGLLNVVDAPTAVFAAGVAAGLSGLAFAASMLPEERQGLRGGAWWQKPAPVVTALLALGLVNALTPIGFRPLLVKDQIERYQGGIFERWNSYSRIEANLPSVTVPPLWAPSAMLPPELRVPLVWLNIDGWAGTTMYHYDGTPDSIDFLQYDMVNLAYRLPGIRKSAVIGVGGGRDILSARYFGVNDITGVELNPIFVDLQTRDPFYAKFSNLTAIPGLKLHVDDARSWFAATHERFDLVQMSMIDTWAATGAGAFSLSENGLYTLQGWRAFLNTLTPNGLFTVSRWYSSGDINETGRMIGLATAALLDQGKPDARPYLFIATDDKVATLVLSNAPLTPQQLGVLRKAVEELGFTVLLAPDQPPESPLLRDAIASRNLRELNRALNTSYLDLTVPTDSRPFFFNQLRLFDVPSLLTIARMSAHGQMKNGVIAGNIVASAVLLLVLVLSIVAVVATILLPLRRAANACSRELAVAGGAYFALIGAGFMLAEIALLQSFSVYLGHPIYALGVCLFSLILASGLGSLCSTRLRLDTRAKLTAWAALIAACLLLLALGLPTLFAATTGRERLVRIGVALATILPLGFLLGFAFPAGMRLVEAIDKRPTPWFWGINGAMGVLASVLGVVIGMAFGIDATLMVAAGCYLLLIPAALALLRLGPAAG